MDQLEEVLGAPQVLEPMGAQVAQGGPVRELVQHQGGCRRRQQHLAAVAGRHDPRGTVDRRAEVVARARLRLAGVQPHPDPEGSRLPPRLVRQVTLGCHAGAHASDGGREDRHHSVAGGLEHLPVGACHGGTQDRVMALQGALHGAGEPLPKPGAALDVGEQEGQGS
jgi:hypothetical protein